MSVEGLWVAFAGNHAGHRADECLDTFGEPLRWGETGLDVEDEEGLAHARLRGRSRRRRLLWLLGICIDLAGLFAGKPAPTEGRGGLSIVDPPDATKPALGGFCFASYLVGRGNLN